MGEAVTAAPKSLVIGECGVPHLIGVQDDPRASPVKGERWGLGGEMLQGIDQYEGIDKGHHSRQEIEVVGKRPLGLTIRYKAFCYFYAIKPGASDVDDTLLNAPRIPDYTVEDQKKSYKPINHNQVK